MQKLLVLAAVSLSALAFAPAPLPRRDRAARADEVTLDSFQGTWQALSLVNSCRNGNHSPELMTFTHVRVRGDRWTFMTEGHEGNGLFLAIDPTQRPAHLNFFLTSDKRAVYGAALIRRHAGGVQVMYSWNADRGRLTGFDPAPDGYWILTLRR